MTILGYCSSAESAIC